MSLDRVPFDEAKKRLTVSSIPKSLRHQLALNLDKFCESNWEYLAEKLDVSPQEIEWVRNTVIHSPSGSPTFRLFDTFLVPRDVLLEKFLDALDAIKNFASVKVLTDGYSNGAFDSTLKQLSSNGYRVNTKSLKDQCPSLVNSCKSFEHQYHSSPSFQNSGNCRECPRYDWTRFEHESFQKVPNSDGSFSSGSTNGSTEGNVDSISYTEFNSDYSAESYTSSEHGIPFHEALYRMENQLPSITDAAFPHCVAAEGDDFRLNRSDDVLDLSRGGQIQDGVKIKRECCHNGVECEEKPRQNGIEVGHQECFGHHHPRNGRLKLKEEIKCVDRQDVSAGLRCSPCLQAKCMCQQRVKQETIKPEPQHRDERVSKSGSNLWVTDMTDRDNMSCRCLGNSKSCQKNDIAVPDPAKGGGINMRDGMPQCPPVKRISHPPLKEDMDDRDAKRNPDGTTPIRNTGSSYGVVQQSPFKKDSRSVRVFVTYADDSKKHMRRVMQLCDCLKKNSFSVSLDVRETTLLSQDRIGWYDKRFKVADYVLVLISPKYFQDVTEPERSKKSPDDELALNTLYIHRCMQAEYMDNNCINKRFIPVLMPGATRTHIPVWLQNTTKYVWPEQYKNLFFYMMYPAHVISNFVNREKSAKMPTVQQTSH